MGRRAGRPRRFGPVRQPDGRPRPAPRQRDRGTDEHRAKRIALVGADDDPRAGSWTGILAARALIGDRELRAAGWYAGLYRRVFGAVTPQAVDGKLIASLGPVSVEGINSAAERTAESELLAAQSAVRSRGGAALLALVNDACIHDRAMVATAIPRLVLGLIALADHFFGASNGNPPRQAPQRPAEVRLRPAR